MALALDEFVVKNGISAVSLDGPQGWRDPNAGNRRGVGRWCEYEARTPGKTGEFRTTYPRNYLGWVSFSIDVFRELDALGRATLVNDPDLQAELPWLDAGRYYILECFPTSTWRASGLDPLPGHRRAPQNVVQNYAGLLQGRYDLPAGAITNHHDNLQAIVAALPAAAVLGGPCQALGRGLARDVHPALQALPEHWVEGLIWDAAPTPGALEAGVIPAQEAVNLYDAAGDGENPLLPDERDEACEEVLQRGVELFRDLVGRANRGQSVGVGYAQFVRIVYRVARFDDVMGRTYKPGDSRYVVRLALGVTRVAGGRLAVRNTKNGVTIQAGMDTFIWSEKPPHDRPLRAWQNPWAPLPYSRDEWLRVFPHGSRTLLP